MPLRDGALPSEINRWLHHCPPLHLFATPVLNR
jgi:hypothetical protein